MNKFDELYESTLNEGKTKIVKSRHYKGNEPIVKKLIQALYRYDNRWENEGIKLKVFDSDKGTTLSTVDDGTILVKADDYGIDVVEDYDYWKRWN